MPQDNSVTREQLVTALVEQIKSGGADALGFDSLLKERAADQWNDLRKEAIDGFVDKKIQEAMKGYINRVFQIAGLIGIVMLGFLATKLINMTQSTDIASQIIDQLKNNKNSEIARSLEDTIAYFNKLKSDADSNFSYAVNSVESVKQEANKLNGKLTSYEKTQIALDQISNELTISQNTAQEVIKKIEANQNSLTELQGAQAMSQELLKRQYQSMTKEEEIEFRDKLRNIPSLDDVQLRVSVCDTDYDEIGKFRYAGKTDKSSEVTTVVCLSKNRNFLGSPANVFKSFVK